MSAAQVPEWVRVFSAVTGALGFWVFVYGVGVGIYYLICLTVKGIKALFRRKGKTEPEAEPAPKPSYAPLSIWKPAPSYDLIDKILKLMDQHFEVVKDLQEEIDDLEERVEELELHESDKRHEAVEEFKRKAQETEKFVADKFREFNENIKESNKILEPLTRLGEILKESKK